MNGSISKEEAEDLFDTYKQYVYRGALFLVKYQDVAEDITQEVFIKVFNSYQTFDKAKDIKPWLYKIMLNTVRSTMKKKHYDLELDEKIVQIDRTNIEGTYLQQEGNKKLWQEVCKLSTKTKEVIFLHYYMDMSLEQIADTLGIPVGTCKSRLNAGLSKLRNKMSTTTDTYCREVRV